MFSWKSRENLDPYFRILHGMQLVAVMTALVSLTLAWWGGGEIASQNGFDLLARSTDRLLALDPRGVTHPLVVLWLLWPVIAVTGLRASIGVVVVPVSFRVVSLVTWVLALLALAHFYINFGEGLAPDADLKGGAIEPGFWFTTMAIVTLGLLILAEFLIRERDDPWIVRQGPVDGPVTDAERIWQGAYQTCPHCGTLNELRAKACINCHNLLFRFGDDT